MIIDRLVTPRVGFSNVLNNRPLHMEYVTVMDITDSLTEEQLTRTHPYYGYPKRTEIIYADENDVRAAVSLRTDLMRQFPEGFTKPRYTGSLYEAACWAWEAANMAIGHGFESGRCEGDYWGSVSMPYVRTYVKLRGLRLGIRDGRVLGWASPETLEIARKLEPFAVLAGRSIFNPYINCGKWYVDFEETSRTIDEYAADSLNWRGKTETLRGELDGVPYIAWSCIHTEKFIPRRPLLVVDMGAERYVLEVDIRPCNDYSTYTPSHMRPAVANLAL